MTSYCIIDAATRRPVPSRRRLQDRPRTHTLVQKPLASPRRKV
jgi:hypothetical protein